MDSNTIDLLFLSKFPDGLNDEMWIELGKKHKPNKIIETINNELSEDNLKEMLENEDYKTICTLVLKLVKKATVVSVFEKVAFQNFINDETTNKDFALAFFDLLYNYNEKSFNEMVSVLAMYKQDKNKNACKWPVITFFISYKDPNKFVILKPNTVKQTAKILEFNIEYSSTPNFKTYTNVINMVENYRENSMICKNENLMIAQAILFTIAN